MAWDTAQDRLKAAQDSRFLLWFCLQPTAGCELATASLGCRCLLDKGVGRLSLKGLSSPNTPELSSAVGRDTYWPRVLLQPSSRGH